MSSRFAPSRTRPGPSPRGWACETTPGVAGGGGHIEWPPRRPRKTGALPSVCCETFCQACYSAFIPRSIPIRPHGRHFRGYNEQPELGSFHIMGGRTGQGQCWGQGLGPVGVAPQLVSQKTRCPCRGPWAATPSDPWGRVSCFSLQAAKVKTRVPSFLPSFLPARHSFLGLSRLPFL